MEDDGRRLLAAETKRKARHPRLPRTFAQAYPEAESTLVYPDNLLVFLK